MPVIISRFFGCTNTGHLGKGKIPERQDPAEEHVKRFRISRLA
jgi:hypothetical protein